MTRISTVRHKVILAGPPLVGKTAFVWRHQTVNPDYDSIKSTIGCDISPLRFRTPQGNVTFDVWDIACHSKYHNRGDADYIGASAAIYMDYKSV